MASLVSRLVACLVAVVAILQLVHLVLLNKLETRRLTELHHLQQNFPGDTSRIAGMLLEDEGAGLPQDLVRYPEELDNINKSPSGPALSSSGHYSNVGLLRSSKGVQYNKRVEYGTSLLDNIDVNSIPENELLVDRLLREDEGAIVDSTGEYRIVFDIAGPRPENSGGVGGVSGIPVGFVGGGGGPSGSISNSNKPSNNNDDFSIDDEIFEAESSIDVTLVTHSDLENGRRFLLPLVTRWEGPVSIAIYASNSTAVEATLEFILQARLCSELVRQFVTFHLVLPLVETHSTTNKKFINKTRGGGGSDSSSASNSHSGHKKTGKKKKVARNERISECQHFLKDSYKMAKPSSSERVLSTSYYGGGPAYPTNLLRNIARKRVGTDFTLVTDIDTVPSQGLRSKFSKFAREKELLKPNGDERKSVFVVPAFESKNGEAPESKRELLSLIDKYQVRPYDFDLCWKCQVHTDYETWQREQRGSRKSDLSVLFEVLWKDPWEPFFISDNSVPLFDERFRRRGFTRISQLCELHVAGYKFAVLNDAFLLHRGYITPPPFHPKRNRDLDTNRAHFRQFKTELKAKYPLSTRRCY